MRRLQVLSGEKYQEDKALQNITIIFRKGSHDINQKQGHALLILNLTFLWGKDVCPHVSLHWCLPNHFILFLNLCLRELGFVFTYNLRTRIHPREKAWQPSAGGGGCWSHGVHSQEVEWTPVLRQRALPSSFAWDPSPWYGVTYI